MDEFERYIERYCNEFKISREEALKHAIVKEIGKYYENAQKGKISVTEANCGCGGMEVCDDKSC